MAEVRKNEAMQEYRVLQANRPQLFDNPESGGIKLLLTDSEIARARQINKERLAREDLPEQWAQTGVVFRDQYLIVLRDAVAFPDGQVGTYIRVIESDQNVCGVAALPVLEGNVLLLRHFRHATRRWHLEIPRGFGASDQSAEANARRELAEEIGATTSRLVSLGGLHANSGLTGEETQLFLAYLDSVGSCDTHEGIDEVVRLRVDEIESLIADGTITDSFTLAAYARGKTLGLL